jgi:hypothetical protein
LDIDSLVEWIAIRFEEGTYLLEVKDLHDFERNEVPHNVSVSRPPDGAPDRTWYWNYKPQWHRRKGRSITIGVKFVATQKYNGKLFVKMYTREAERAIRLSFVVLESKADLAQP